MGFSFYYGEFAGFSAGRISGTPGFLTVQKRRLAWRCNAQHSQQLAAIQDELKKLHDDIESDVRSVPNYPSEYLDAGPGVGHQTVNANIATVPLSSALIRGQPA